MKQNGFTNKESKEFSERMVLAAIKIGIDIIAKRKKEKKTRVTFKNRYGEDIHFLVRTKKKEAKAGLNE